MHDFECLTPSDHQHVRKDTRETIKATDELTSQNILGTRLASWAHRWIGCWSVPAGELNYTDAIPYCWRSPGLRSTKSNLILSQIFWGASLVGTHYLWEMGSLGMLALQPVFLIVQQRKLSSCLSLTISSNCQVIWSRSANFQHAYFRNVPSDSECMSSQSRRSLWMLWEGTPDSQD